MADAMETVRRTASHSVTLFKTAAGLGSARHHTQLPEPANEAEPAPAPEPARPEPTVLSANAEFKGSIVTSDSVEIRGRIEGDIRASSIKVCAGARIKGDLVADVILIQGAVEGRIEAQDIRLQAGANVVGEIVHGSLGIDTTAIFEGTIKRLAPTAA
jgi:cytoskeletal protein CcmA (bactofilin family)